MNSEFSRKTSALRVVGVGNLVLGMIKFFFFPLHTARNIMIDSLLHILFSNLA